MARPRARRRATLLGLLAAVLGLQLALAASPASADVGTSIEFTTTSPVQVAFGENWVIQATTQAIYLDGAFPGTTGLGTVDVFLSGMAEPFSTGLPIQLDGAVYITQPAGKPTLPAGDYQMTAVLHASSESGLEDSETPTPLAFSVKAFGVAASVSADATTLAEEPVLEARLAGEYVDATGGAPGGTWTFAVSDGAETILETEVAQEPGAKEPLRYPISEELDDGTEYRVVSTFTPVDALAGGLQVEQPADTTFRTPDGGIGDTLGAPIPFPLWLLIVCGVLVLGLIATAIILTVKAGGASSSAAPAAPPAEADREEFAGVEDLFPLQSAAAESPAGTPTTPMSAVDTPTQAYPAPMPSSEPAQPPFDWSLDGQPEETKTELIDPDGQNDPR